MIIPAWALMAFSASIMWGLSYAIVSRLFQAGISPIFLIVMTNLINLPFYIWLLLRTDNWQNNFRVLFSGPGPLFILAIHATTIVMGILLIYSAIQSKNATYASIIEITYPLFVFLFSWALFREVHMSWNVALGGLLIFCGSALVFLRSGT